MTDNTLIFRDQNIQINLKECSKFNTLLMRKYDKIPISSSMRKYDKIPISSSMRQYDKIPISSFMRKYDNMPNNREATKIVF